MSFPADDHRLDRPAARSQAGLLLSDVIEVVRENWKVIAGTAFGGAVALIGLSFLVTPTFRATAIYAPANASQQGGSSLLGGQAATLASFAGIAVPSLGTTQRLAALVNARAITLRALQEENALPLLFAGSWDAQAHRWKKKKPSPQDILEAFEGARVVTPDATANLLSVQVTLKDPVLAARLANRLAFYVNEYERNRAREESQRAMAFLSQQLSSAAQSSLHDSLTMLMNAELQKATLVNARKDYMLEVIDPAIVPEHKIAPKRSMFAIFGFLLGGGLALFWGLYRRRKAARTGGSGT